MKQPKNTFSLWESCLPFVASVSLLFLNTYLFGERAGEGYNQLALVLGGIVAGILGWRKGVLWQTMYRGVMVNVQPILPTLVFVLLIGGISVTWLMGGIIPAMVYYGIRYVHSAVFLMATTLFAVVMGLMCGSSWLTVSTMGVALMGMGKVLGFPMPVVAGAIISGAYCGDKLTPLSETTVLAASMTGTPLLRHVRYMLRTSGATLCLTLVLFGVLGLNHYSNVTSTRGEEVMGLLEELFDLRMAWLLVPVGIMVLTMVGCPPLAVLSLGMLLGGAMGMYYQANFLNRIGHESSMNFSSTVGLIASSVWCGVEVTHDDPIIQQLCISGGMWGMWDTITIIFASLVLSGMMEGSGLLSSFIHRVTSINTPTKLVVFTSLAAVCFNITVADQYLAIILTSKIVSRLFAQQGLARENASRAVEDAATVTSPLIPWNTCGIAQARMLGVPTLQYMPYCFFNWLSPIMSILFMALGIGIARSPFNKRS